MTVRPDRPVHLRCESHLNPLAVQRATPRLSWQYVDRQRNAIQRAYRIQVGTTVESLESENALLWDSGRVESADCVLIPYAGVTLHSAQTCYWRVQTWNDATEPSDWSRVASWEMGLLDASDWQADWIGTAMVGDRQTGTVSPLLRRSFNLPAEPVRARLYVTALGLYEFHLNGQRIGADVFSPGWTDYARRRQYQVYDVTPLLTAGANVAGCMLGDGWYCGHIAQFGRQHYGDRPKLLAQLVITCADGSEHTIVTDERWRWAMGPVVANDLLMGESYDARLEQPGWDRPGVDEAPAQWFPVQRFEEVEVPLVASTAPPVRATQLIEPIAPPRRADEQHWSSQHWVFDLGQNFSGRVRLRVKGKRGQLFRIRHAEMLRPDGKLYVENLRYATATDWYTCRGDAAGEVYEPRFTFHGFRYVEVRGFTEMPDASAVTGVVLHSDLPTIGEFECSNPDVNQLQSNIVWGQRSNFLEVPTDCPQRDERLGWTGDAQVFVATACFNQEVSGFFNKWQDDLADAQSPEGAFPEVVPNVLPGGKDGGPGWADAGLICPWTIYRRYGDRSILEQHYASMVRFVDYLEETSCDLIRAGDPSLANCGFGDWLAVDAPNPGSAPTPKDLIGTAYFAHATALMAQIAEVLGYDGDQRRFENLAAHIRRAFQKTFVSASGRVVGHTQTGYLMSLAFDLLPDEMRPIALGHLVDLIEARGDHLATGFLGTPLLAPVLSRFQRSDVAYRLLLQRTYPSWLYSVDQGATTMWERWNSYSHEHGFGDVNMNSFNHYAYGAIGQWLYATVAGIDVDVDASSAGYRHVLIRPIPGGDLTWARAALTSPYGRIATHWEREGDQFSLRVEIPANTTATVVLPTADPSTITAYAAGDHAPLDLAFAMSDEGCSCSCRIGSGAYRFDVSSPAGKGESHRDHQPQVADTTAV
ncbi:family 78 glycoside hydrolase catalytic domain [Phycisphaerales bacterium AB-hyl4]|uniref:alpha-L-rhamnosidase n=1 Tax=Natronomicrosphaera hydrolytica TaxID=3242702 RepID=A0ABV4U9V0_9BACT